MPNRITSKLCSVLARVGLVLALTVAAIQLSSQQRQRPPAGPQPLNSPMLQAPPPVQIHAPGKGAVTGYIYWDTSRTTHSPANVCNGLSLTLSAAYSAGTYTPLAGQPEQLGWIGQVANFGVCGYKVSKLPTDTELRVEVSVNPSSSFSPAVLPPSAPQVRAHNSLCTNLQGPVPTVAQLQGKWTSCNNTVFNVNFALAPSSQILGGAGHGVLLHPTPPSVGSGPVRGSAPHSSLLLHPGEVSPGPINKSASQVLRSNPSEINPGPTQNPSSHVLVTPGPIQTPAARGALSPTGALPLAGTPRIIKGTKSKIALATKQ